jgi:hypothetical protein
LRILFGKYKYNNMLNTYLTPENENENEYEDENENK